MSFPPKKKTCWTDLQRNPKWQGWWSKLPRLQRTFWGMERRLMRKTISYKDICLGVNGHNVSEDDAFFFDCIDKDMDNGAPINNQEHGQGFLGDPLCLVVRLIAEERTGIRVPWRRSIIIKLLGRRISLRYFQAGLYKLWQPKALKIDVNTLREKFDASGDFTTERAKFAKICIEVDLNKVLISKFSLEGRVYSVEYEGLHLHNSIDPGKEVFPHSNDQAGPVANTTVGQPPEDDNSYGPWMLVQKSSRRNIRDASVSRGGNKGTELIQNSTKQLNVVAKRKAMRSDETIPKGKADVLGSKNNSHAGQPSKVKDVAQRHVTSIIPRHNNEVGHVSNARPGATCVETHQVQDNTMGGAGSYYWAI
ncbi:hypothetical protein SESBI_37810 [Sesbania bispinosa]|nr:hypothetical protein SESBI_37810 [Sesbania bispinosa]